MLVACAYDNVL